MFGSDQQLSIIIKARDEASAIFSKVQQNATQLGSRLRSAEEASRHFALGLTAGVAAIGGLGYAAIKAAGDMEQTKIAFETMLGSASKADTFVKQLVSFAKTTPFELTGVNTAAKQLLAYGFAQEEVIPNLKALGDIAAGVGMDKLPNLILAFGQVKAATRLTGMELRQFTEAGVPLLGMLAEQMGKPVSAIQEMVSAGQIGFAEVQKALMNLTGEGGRFNDLMAKQSKSFGGMMSNLKDAWNLFLAGEGQKVLEWAKRFVEIAIYIIQNVLPAWIEKIQAMIDFFQEHKTVLYIVAGAIMGALVPAIWAAVYAFGALVVALAPFMLAGAAIGGVIAGITWMVKHWDIVKEKIGQVADKFKFLADMYDKVAKLVSKPINFVTNLGGSTASAVKGFISNLAGFEHGGIVPGPAGMPVPIMAHGQERIISAGSGSGSDKTIVMNFHFNGTVAGDQGIKSIITQTINDLSRQSTLKAFAGA